jgi:rubrerythrin
MEQKAERFYCDSARKLVIPEVSTTFLRLAEDGREDALSLRNILE